MTLSWALAPVTLPIPCGEQHHELRWADGVLASTAHPDADRERALAALGAEPSPCLQILDAWNRHADDLDVLVLASRGPSDLRDQEMASDVTLHAPGSVGFASYVPLSQATTAYGSRLRFWPGPMPRRYVDYVDESPGDGVEGLLRLGFGLPHRLAATVIATWAERIEAGDERVAAATPALDAALYGRMAAALLPWLAGPANLEFTMLAPRSKPVLCRDGDAVRVELPLAWLRDVWANGLAVILDRFCIRADRTAPDAWTLTTVDRDLASLRTVTISG